MRQSKRGRVKVRQRHRSEEHTSELQSRLHLVCRLLLEKKKTTTQESAEDHSTDGPSGGYPAKLGKAATPTIRNVQPRYNKRQIDCTVIHTYKTQLRDEP